MRVTVIFSDADVYVAGVVRNVEMPAHDGNWRAIQWDGESGDVEVSVGAGFSFNDPAIVAPFVDAWNAAAPPPAIAPLPPGADATSVEEM